MVVVTAILAVSVLSACTQDDSVQVKSYNNDIVQIQKDMFTKAEDASAVFQQQNIDPQKVLTTLQGIQGEINTSHDKFVKMEVPKGAERLSEAMEKFFQVEIGGIQKIIVGVQQIQGHETDPTAAQAFTDTFAQFSSQENAALKDFYSTQQAVADKYGQKVVQTDEN